MTGDGELSLRTVANTAAITSAVPISAETPRLSSRKTAPSRTATAGLTYWWRDDRRDRQAAERPDVGRERDARRPRRGRAGRAASAPTRSSGRARRTPSSTTAPIIITTPAVSIWMTRRDERVGGHASAAGRRTIPSSRGATLHDRPQQPRVSRRPRCRARAARSRRRCRAWRRRSSRGRCARPPARGSPRPTATSVDASTAVRFEGACVSVIVTMPTPPISSQTPTIAAPRTSAAVGMPARRPSDGQRGEREQRRRARSGCPPPPAAASSRP